MLNGVNQQILLIAAVVSFLMSVVAFVAIIRLFSIDATLRDIRAELQRQRGDAQQPASVPRPSRSVTTARILFGVLMCVIAVLIVVAINVAH